MANWHYNGQSPTPVEIPGRGSVAIKKNQRFEAPESAVAHLVSIGLVRRLPDSPPAPMSAKNVMEEPAPMAKSPQEGPPAPVTETEEKVEPRSDAESGRDLDVVGSTESEPLDVVAEAAEAVPGDDSVIPVEKKKQQRSGQRKAREPEQT